MKKRNGKIELFRFIFCLAIIGFHLNVDYWNGEKNLTEYISFFGQGRIGVEFFFAVSGYLLAAAVYKKIKYGNNNLGKETVQFIYHKWMAIFPFHIIVYLITFIVVIVCRKLNLFETIKVFIDSLPNLFLIQKTGIYSKNLIGVEWYISTMLLAMVILYPLCKRYYNQFSKIIAPIITIFLVGYMCHETGGLSRTADWTVVCAKVQLRAIAELCLGIFCFECCRYISKLNIRGCIKGVLTITEWGCYMAAFFFAISTLGRKYEPYALYALYIAVMLSFSKKTFSKGILDNKIVYFLGKISLPMYLIQNAIRELVQFCCIDIMRKNQIILIFILIFGSSIVILYLGNRFKNLLDTIKIAMQKEM